MMLTVHYLLAKHIWKLRGLHYWTGFDNKGDFCLWAMYVRLNAIIALISSLSWLGAIHVLVGGKNLLMIGLNLLREY